MKAKRKKRRNSPEEKAKSRAYHARPEVKAKRTEYEARPDVQAKIKALCQHTTARHPRHT